jgi:hypothetical protein
MRGSICNVDLCCATFEQVQVELELQRAAEDAERRDK